VCLASQPEYHKACYGSASPSAGTLAASKLGDHHVKLGYELGYELCRLPFRSVSQRGTNIPLKKKQKKTTVKGHPKPIVILSDPIVLALEI